jgi:hypothetical protein
LNADFNQILSTTLKNYIGGDMFVDAVFDSAQLLTAVYKNKVRRIPNTGEKFTVGVEYAHNETFEFVGEYDPVNKTQTQFLTRAEFPWTIFAGSYTVSDLELKQNRGKEAVKSLAKAKLENARKSAASKLNQRLWVDPPANAQGTPHIIGLPGAVSAGNPTQGNYGGINRSTNAQWRAQVNHSGSGSALQLLNLSSAIHSAMDGTNEYPNVIVTTQELWERIESLYAGKYAPTTLRDADSGIKSDLVYRGVPIIWDVFATANNVWVLNTNYWYVIADTNQLFEVGDGFRNDQLATTYPIAMFGNIICSNPRMQCLLDGQLRA